MGTKTWTIAEAKAKLSEMINTVEKQGPQTITRHGEPVAIVVSSAEWERKTKRKGSLVDFLNASPLRNSGLDLNRNYDTPAEIKL